LPAKRFHHAAKIAKAVFGKRPRRFPFAPRPKPGRGAAGAVKESSAKIWRAFVCKCAAISPRKISPNSRSFFSPTPLMRENRLSFADNSAPSAAATRRKNDVGRHVALVGKLFAQLRAISVEQNFVAGDFADAMDFAFRRRRRVW
jgi:hypothetical protein